MTADDVEATCDECGMVFASAAAAHAHDDREHRHESGRPIPDGGSRVETPTTARPDTTRLNLGCGPDYRSGWHNVDIRESVDPDEVVDLDVRPWPWPDNHFDVVLALNVVEHLDDQLGALEELHRVTASGGEIRLAFPHPASRSQWVDPTHEHTLLPETFEHDLAPAFEVVDVSCSRVRFGRALPESWALWWADHFGHLVDEIQVVVEVADD